MIKIIRFLLKIIYVKREDQQASLNINLSFLFIMMYLLVVLMGISHITISLLKANLSETHTSAVHLALIAFSFAWIKRYKEHFYEIDEKGSLYNFGQFNGTIKIVLSVSILAFLILVMQSLMKVF